MEKILAAFIAELRAIGLPVSLAENVDAAAALRPWIGDEGRSIRLGCQFRAPNTKGQIVTAHGEVTAIREEDGETIEELEIWTDNDSGKVMAPGTATVALSRG